jgi:hypothetical protein
MAANCGSLLLCRPTRGLPEGGIDMATTKRTTTRTVTRNGIRIRIVVTTTTRR